MDNSNKNRQNEYLGVNKSGKNIRKSPLHQPNFGNNNNKVLGSSPARQPPQPQIYNISKNDFRSIVQQLTGSPSHNDPLPRPPTNPPKNPSMRLQRIRPPPLTPINRPPLTPVVVAQAPILPLPQGPPQGHYNNNNNSNFGRPPPQFGQLPLRGVQPQQFGQPSPRGMHPSGRGEGSWTTPALSPISAYMQQLQSCIGEGGQRPGQQQMQPQMPGQVPGQNNMQPQIHGYISAQPPILQQVPGQGPGQPRHPIDTQGHVHFQAQPRHPMDSQDHGHFQAQPPVHPQGPGNMQAQPTSSGLLPYPPLPSPGAGGLGLLPSPGTGGPGLLPSPTSQFLLPSPGGYFNILSPTTRSPYPLLSPGSQFPPPLSPNFAFSPYGHHGILGTGPQPPLSPGISFPSSPSGFFPLLSPRWRN